jgi:2-keto-3-deoxy-L-rhamnonate aldolase RhmA
MGHRGVGLGSAHTDFVVPDPPAYFREANENTTIIAMIESPRGVANADAIAAMPGVDVVWVGLWFAKILSVRNWLTRRMMVWSAKTRSAPSSCIPIT